MSALTPLLEVERTFVGRDESAAFDPEAVIGLISSAAREPLTDPLKSDILQTHSRSCESDAFHQWKRRGLTCQAQRRGVRCVDINDIVETKGNR
jgi:hypothetical protein